MPKAKIEEVVTIFLVI